MSIAQPSSVSRGTIGLGRPRAEHLEPALRVLDPGEAAEADDDVEHASHGVAMFGFADASGARALARSDREVALRRHEGDEPGQFGDRHRQVGVAHEPEIAARREQPGSERAALAAVGLAPKHDPRVARGGLRDDLQRPSVEPSSTTRISHGAAEAGSSF